MGSGIHLKNHLNPRTEVLYNLNPEVAEAAGGKTGIFCSLPPPNSPCGLDRRKNERQIGIQVHKRIDVFVFTEEKPVSCPQNIRYTISRGAEGRMDARRQNPAGRKSSSTVSARFRKGTRAYRLCLRKYSENEVFGSIHSKISVSSRGTNAYFGKRSGLTLGSRHQGSTLPVYSRDTTLGDLFGLCG